MHPLTSHLIPLVTSDYYDGSQMNGAVNAECRQHLKQSSELLQAGRHTFTQRLDNGYYFTGRAGEAAALVCNNRNQWGRTRKGDAQLHNSILRPWMADLMIDEEQHANTDLKQMHCGNLDSAHSSVHSLRRGLQQINKDTPRCGILKPSHGQQSPGCCSDKNLSCLNKRMLTWQEAGS